MRVQMRVQNASAKKVVSSMQKLLETTFLDVLIGHGVLNPTNHSSLRSCEHVTGDGVMEFVQPVTGL